MSSDEKSLEELAKAKLKKDLESDDVSVMKEKIENYENILEISSENQFRKDKKDILEKVPESKREKIEAFIGSDPSRIEIVKAGLILNEEDVDADDDDRIPEKSVSGRAILPSKDSEEKDTVESLYGIINTKFADPKLKALAKQRIDELWAGLESKHKSKFVQSFRKMKSGEIKEGDKF